MTRESIHSSRSAWTHFQHVADVGVRGSGASLAEAFAATALALTAIVCDPARIACRKRVEIDCEAPDAEYLLVEWLNAVIYEMATRHMLFGRFEVEIHEHRLHGLAYGEAIDVQRHEPAVEIKGATYTALEVRHDEHGVWHAQCVLDV